MSKLEARLRQELPELADALIALHEEQGQSTADQQEQAATSGIQIGVTAQRLTSDRQSDRWWAPLLVAASIVLVLLGLGAVGLTMREANDDESSPVVAAQLDDTEEDAEDSGDTDEEDGDTESARNEQHRAALLADPPTTLDEAQRRWEAEGPDDYLFRLQIVNIGPTIDLEIEVRDGSATMLDPMWFDRERSGIEPPEIDPEWIATVDELLARLAEASPTIVPTFDPEFGYPTSFRLDPDLERQGDDLTFRVTELSSIAEIEVAERALAAWLPEPGFLPPELADSRLGAAGSQRLYQLFDAGDLTVNLVRQQRLVCVLMTRKDPGSEYFTGMSQSGCNSVARLHDVGVSTGWFGPPPGGQLAFVAVLPASHHDQTWTVEVATDGGYELMQSEQALLIIFSDDGPPGPVPILVSCECGELTYEPTIG